VCRISPDITPRFNSFVTRSRTPPPSFLTVWPSPSLCYASISPCSSQGCPRMRSAVRDRPWLEHGEMLTEGGGDGEQLAGLKEQLVGEAFRSGATP